MAISMQLTQDGGHPYLYRVSYGSSGPGSVMVWTDRPILSTPTECADIELKVLALLGFEGGSVASWMRLDASDQQIRIGAATVLVQLGQQDRTITWNTPMPTAKYSVDVGAFALVGNGTAAVLSQTAAGCVVRLNITSLAGLAGSVTVVAVA